MDQSSKSEGTKVRELAVDLPESGFETVLFFNRFGVETSDTHVIAHFGYVARTGDVLSSYTTAFPKAFLDVNRDDWLEYLGKVGQPPQRAIDASWRPPVSQSRRVEFANAMRLARLGQDAEIRCYATSIVSIVDKGRSSTQASKPIQSQPLALLQSSLEQQQLLLLALVKYQDL